MAGSSPPVRGARFGVAAEGLAGGLIPACAGSTGILQGPVRILRAHPRLCGEHQMPYASAPLTLGSSPPVRGAQSAQLLNEAQRGLIPACAGSTAIAVDAAQSLRAHPRLCGEHRSDLLPGCTRSGSSPPVRGALASGNEVTNALGLIPACAGSTLGSTFTAQNKGAHPRLCGEHSSSAGYIITR